MTAALAFLALAFGPQCFGDVCAYGARRASIDVRLNVALLPSETVTLTAVGDEHAYELTAVETSSGGAWGGTRTEHYVVVDDRRDKSEPGVTLYAVDGVGVAELREQVAVIMPSGEFAEVAP